MRNFKKTLAMLLALTMCVSALTGCGEKQTASEPAQEAEAEVEAEASEEPATDSKWEYKEGTVTVSISANVSTDVYEEIFALMEETIGLHVDWEVRTTGAEGENVVKTLLAAGEMADIFLYNSGSKLGELSPEENIIDISGEEWADRINDLFKSSVSAGTDAVYGIPESSSRGAVMLYNKAKYAEYGLEVPKTWDEFMANCETLKAAGETAIIGSYGNAYTSQFVYLGDHYNVLAEEPDFAAKFEAGEAKYANSTAGVKSFQKIADVAKYYNEDYTATTYPDARVMFAEGEGVHICGLSNALGFIAADYPEAMDNIGAFAIPGNDADNCGLTVWMPEAFYGNANSENRENILRFMEFYISDEALDAYAAVVQPCGPYCIEGYELPEDCYAAVKEDLQAYFDAGKTALALEFETSVKGASCEQICQEVGIGQISAEEGAAAYDADCVKMATQLGLDW